MRGDAPAERTGVRLPDWTVFDLAGRPGWGSKMTQAAAKISVESRKTPGTVRSTWSARGARSAHQGGEGTTLAQERAFTGTGPRPFLSICSPKGVEYVTEANPWFASPTRCRDSVGETPAIPLSRGYLLRDERSRVNLQVAGSCFRRDAGIVPAGCRPTPVSTGHLLPDEMSGLDRRSAARCSLWRCPCEASVGVAVPSRHGRQRPRGHRTSTECEGDEQSADYPQT